MQVNMKLHVTSPTYEYVLCHTDIHHNCYTLMCSDCNKPIHLLCLIQEYKESTGTTKSNPSLEWSRDSIDFSKLRCSCSKCTMEIKQYKPLNDLNSSTNVSNNKSSIIRLAIENLNKNIADIINEVNTIFHSIKKSCGSQLSDFSESFSKHICNK